MPIKIHNLFQGTEAKNVAVHIIYRGLLISISTMGHHEIAIFKDEDTSVIIHQIYGSEGADIVAAFRYIDDLIAQ